MRQELLLSTDGQIIESDDQLFEINGITDLSTLDCFPLVESMFPTFLDMNENDIPLLLPGVSSNCHLLSGFFDFTFSKITLNGQTLILWIIEDQTEKYTQMKDQMQVHNDEVIQAEKEQMKQKSRF